MLLIGTLGTNFNEVLIEIHTFSFKNIHFKMSSGKWRPFCPGLNVLTRCMLHGRGSHHVSSIRLLTWVIISSDNSLPPVRRQAITYYFYQYWLIVSWTLRNKLQWNSNQNTKPFVHENAFEDVICEMGVVCPRGDKLTVNDNGVFTIWTVYVFNQFYQ